jgi:hypothetical protein
MFDYMLLLDFIVVQFIFRMLFMSLCYDLDSDRNVVKHEWN